MLDEPALELDRFAENRLGEPTLGEPGLETRERPTDRTRLGDLMEDGRDNRAAPARDTLPPARREPAEALPTLDLPRLTLCFDAAWASRAA